MSLWQHGHSSLWVQIHILQHQPTRSTDQFQPDKRWVSGNLICLSLQLVFNQFLCVILWSPIEQRRGTLSPGLISTDFCYFTAASGRGLFLSMDFKHGLVLSIPLGFSANTDVEKRDNIVGNLGQGEFDRQKRPQVFIKKPCCLVSSKKVRFL